MDKIYLLTSNNGKYNEIKIRLYKAGIILEKLDLPHPEIQSDTLDEVVQFKTEWARYAKPNHLVLTDDSGLFIESLKGFPGVYSSYVFCTIGCDGILNLLSGYNSRKAKFECCFGFSIPKFKETLTFKGICKGKISIEMAGKNGFGFDPIFIPDGKKITFAQMTTDEKNRISHRGKAIDRLIVFLKNNKI